MRVLLVVSIALVLAGSNALDGENNETSTRNNTDGSPNEADDKMIRRVEEQMLTLNKSNDAFRNKRALGILLQGFMEALGYTVSPIQLGSLSIGPAAAAPAMAAPQMPPPAQPMNLQQAGPMPPPQGNPIPAPPPANATPAAAAAAAAAAASAPPRQRETLRFTGVLNFGNNSNATNLIEHLSQYERIFHGGGAPQPPAAPAPSVDPRSLPPLPEPLFVKIPLPIVPNLPPPQPPSPMPVQNTYHEGYQQQNHEEEFKGSEDDEGQKGNLEEEDDEGNHHEEYEHSHEEFSEPEDEEEEVEEGHEKYHEEHHEEHHEEPKERKYETAVSHEKPPEKNRETHYKKNQHVVNYSVENKEIRDPSEVSEEVPIDDSKYGHAMYVGEPDWKKQHEEHVYRLAAEQEARAEALAEENAERERSHSAEVEDSAERHQDREKEISENNEKHAARYEGTSREHPNPYYDDVKEKYNNAAEQEDYEEETETRHRETPTNAPPAQKVGVTEAPAARRYEEKVSKSNSRESYQEDKSDRPQPTLPISYDREGSAQHQPLRDSYGESLEKPGGKVDERVADFITMFKNPQTGVYDPSTIQHYDKARIPYDRLDLASGFKKIQQEYGRPESKYEEYEISDEDDNASGGEGNKAEHREGSDDSGEREQHSKEALTDGPHTTECNCNPRKNDAHSEEAKIPDKPATARLPTATPTPLAILDYGPYYSTVRHLYEPSNDQGIIARLTSYGPPTTGKYDAAPTVLAVPEKLTAQSLIQQSETKEITAWPAPFDYVFDNSDHRSVVLKSTPTRQTPLPLTKPTCYHEAHTLPPGKHADRVHMLIREYERDNAFSTEHTKKRKGRPQSSRDRKAEQVGQHSNNKVSYHQAVQTTQASAPKQRKTPQTTSRSESWTEKMRAQTVPSSVLEPPTAPPYRTSHRTTKTSTEKVKSSRQPKGNRQTSRPQTTAKKKHGNFSATPLAGGNPKEERSNYVEKDGILIIPEPTPYYYNENIEEFTDEPQSDTEKVKIKEFRNRIASVKVSQLNQLHPDSSMQIFKYSRNL